MEKTPRELEKDLWMMPIMTLSIYVRNLTLGSWKKT